MATTRNDELTTLVWQDREIRFDSHPSCLASRRGETEIDAINSVEDTKGNNGERGSLVVTNLRLLWIAHRSPRTNLSIGFNTIASLSIRKAKSRMRGGTIQALYIMAKHQSSRFEFIFTSLVSNSPRLFTTVQAVFRAYETSKLYRDLKLRGSVVRDNHIITLPQEEVCNKITGVWNVSRDQGNLGVMYITNVRVVWHSVQAPNFNISVPYMQIEDIRIRESNFGKVLVIQTYKRERSYVLGFRIDSKEAMHTTLQELKSMHRVFAQRPIFGVAYEEEEKPRSMQQVRVPLVEDDVEIVNTDEGDMNASAVYFAEAAKAADREVVFDEHLGLAVEHPAGSATTQSLWKTV